RANGFLARTGGLAGETRDYVRIITGLSAEDWRDAAQDAASPGAADGLDLALAPGPFAPACQALARTRKLSKPKTPAPTYAPWGVQLASGDSAEGARRRFAQRARPCRRALAGERPQIIRKAPQVAGRRTYYVARIGRASRGEANRLCKALRRQTCACAVYRN
ncbi:MAG: SPOR domain-containing protein, partial [Pseudomonadota bacterium]